MFCVTKWSLSLRFIFSSSVPSISEILDVVRECVVIIGRPVSLSSRCGEADEDSLCTFGKSFIKER